MSNVLEKRWFVVNMQCDPYDVQLPKARNFEVGIQLDDQLVVCKSVSRERASTPLQSVIMNMHPWVI